MEKTSKPTKSFFSICNMVRCAEFSVEKCGISIIIPFKIHIKDIPNNVFDEEKENVLEWYSGELLEQNQQIEQKRDFSSLLKFVDLQNFTVEEEIEEYKEDMCKTQVGWIFKSYSSLYSFLVSNLMFNEVDFHLIENFLILEQHKIISAFNDELFSELRMNSNKDDVSESFMLLRGAFESSYSGSLFPENKGLCFSEYSYREIITQRLYFARKCEIEKAMMEEHNKKFKNSK